MFEVIKPVAFRTPRSVFELSVVGVPVVFQQKPCAVTGVSPNELMVPFRVAVVEAMVVAACVLTAANPDVVVKLT